MVLLVSMALPVKDLSAVILSVALTWQVTMESVNMYMCICLNMCVCVCVCVLCVVCVCVCVSVCVCVLET